MALPIGIEAWTPIPRIFTIVSDESRGMKGLAMRAPSGFNVILNDDAKSAFWGITKMVRYRKSPKAILKGKYAVDLSDAACTY